MKKFLQLTLLTFGFNILFAQEEEEAVSVKRVEQMAVFPGCEEIEGNKMSLIQCFSEKLSEEIMKFLDTEYPETINAELPKNL